MTPTHLQADPQRIGLIADSHGNLASTVSCIRRLNRYRIDLMMHLGDIFDSLGDQDLFTLLDTLRQNSILSVKGNNDYQVERALDNGASINIPAAEKRSISGFLKALPLRRVISGICFTHSFPYDSIRSFYEPIDTGSTDRAVQIFATTPFHIIFCGHSHRPVVFRQRSARVTREEIAPASPLCLKASDRYIVIVGSAENGECGLFDKAQMIYRRIRI